MMDLDTLLRCSWCDKRCRDRAELIEHHDEHRREDAAAQPERKADERAAD